MFFKKKMTPKASTQPTPPCCIDRPGERDGSPGFHEPWRIGKACLEYVDTHHQRLVWVTKDGLKRTIWSRSYDGGVGWRTEVFEDSEIEAWLPAGEDLGGRIMFRWSDMNPWYSIWFLDVSLMSIDVPVWWNEIKVVRCFWLDVLYVVRDPVSCYPFRRELSHALVLADR